MMDYPSYRKFKDLIEKLTPEGREEAISLAVYNKDMIGDVEYVDTAIRRTLKTNRGGAKVIQLAERTKVGRVKLIDICAEEKRYDLALELAEDLVNGDREYKAPADILEKHIKKLDEIRKKAEENENQPVVGFEMPNEQTTAEDFERRGLFREALRVAERTGDKERAEVYKKLDEIIYQR